MHKTFIPLALLLFSYSAFAQTIVDVHGQLQVDGSKIKDECGRVAQLKGMSYFWHQWDRSSEYMNKNVMQWLRDDWKVEIVRIPIAVRPGDPCTVLGTQTLTAGQCGGSNPGGVTGKRWAYDVARRSVQAAVDAGLYVILDWHAHPNRQAEAKEFFRTMAQEFGQYPNVIYEIYNEPDAGPGGWNDLNQDWPELKAYSRDLIATIRQYDPDNLIICPTPFYDQFVHQAADDPITVDINNKPVSNIAYTLHIYADAHRFNSQPGEWARYALSKGLPMFVTESGATATDFGRARATGRNTPNYTEYNKWVNWWDENDISFCKWSLSIKDEFGSSLLPGASTAGNWNSSSNLTDEGRWNRNYFRSANSSRPTVCNGETPTPPTTGNVTVRAKGATGTEQIEIRYKDSKVGATITLSTSFKEYKVQVSNANGNFKVAFVNDNGTRDAEIDWLQVGTTKRQAETRSTNTAVWQNNSCGGRDSQLMNCNGYIDFGTMSSATSGQLVIRARGTCGSETMVLQVGGQDVKTWNNLSTSFTNYTYDNYSGSKNVKVRFTNDGTTSSGCDRNLIVDRITVCGVALQAENATRNGCGSAEWLYCNGNFDFGTVGCGSARVANGTTKFLGGEVEPIDSEWFSTYPNPASQQLTVEGSQDYQVTLYDLSGRLMMQQDHLKGKAQLDVSHLRPGLYLMKLRDSEQHEVQHRILIE